MPVIKKIQKNNFPDYCILTAFKTVFKDGHFMPPDIEIISWYITIDYIKGLHYQYRTRVAKNPVEHIIVNKVIEITGKMLDEMFALANKIPNFSIEKLVMSYQDKLEELMEITPKEE